MMTENNVVLVTGAGGFVAGHVISQLLDKNYKVRGTVKLLPEDMFEYKHLTSLPNASTNLEIVQVDLNDDLDCESWSKAFRDDVSTVIHCAGVNKPFLKSGDPVHELIDPSIKGITTICELCQRFENIKRLIVTSCIDALANTFINGKEYSELDWNDDSSPTNNPYAFAKTEIERVLYRYFDNKSSESSKRSSIIAVSILPGIILGPPLTYQPVMPRAATWREATDELMNSNPSLALPGGAALSWRPRLSSSHKLFLTYLNGSNRGVPNLHINISDVRDVATAHLIAMESSRISTGRYIIAAPTSTAHIEMLQIIHDNFHDKVTVPTRRVLDPVVRLAANLDSTGKGEYILRHLGKKPQFNILKSKEVGMAMRPPVQTIVDTCRFLVENKLIEQKSPQGCNIL